MVSEVLRPTIAERNNLTETASRTHVWTPEVADVGISAPPDSFRSALGCRAAQVQIGCVIRLSRFPNV